MTDIHLNFLKSNSDITKFCDFVKADMQDFDGVIITGDISEGLTLVGHLEHLYINLQKPIYYVLGNHDYWHQTWDRVETRVKNLYNRNNKIIWLGASPVIKLSDTTALIGHDGWYDAFHGDWMRSSFRMADWHYIHDFLHVTGNIGAIVGISRKRADIAATYVDMRVREAFAQGFMTVLVATHVPPFEECARHNGNPSDAEALPWYTSKLMGDALLHLANEFPNNRIVVLCGHTHDGYRMTIKPNLEVVVGPSDYGRPQWNKIQVK